ALIEKTTLAVDLVLSDCEPVLDLRRHVEVPVAWLAKVDNPLAPTLRATGAEVRAARGRAAPIYCHGRHLGDAPVIRDLLELLDASFDLAEPFARIGEAIGEARKLGVTSRA